MQGYISIACLALFATSGIDALTTAEDDAQCAANAGISFVGVSWGYNSSDILSQNGARIIVNDFAQLQTSLDDIIPQIG